VNVRCLTLALAASTLALSACTTDGDADTAASLTTLDGTTGDGDGDGDPATGDGDGDGDPTTGDGDGDGDPTTGDGDGDGDPTTGDGDGDPTTTGGGAACMGETAPAGVLAVGQPVSHWAGFTSEGEDWDYCELEGTPFILVVSGAWCGPCQDLASGMAGMNSSWGAQLDPILAGLQAGTLGFVEVLLDNFQDFGPASVSDLQAWEAMYPNEYVHLIGDPTEGLNGNEPLWIYLADVHMGSVPSGILVDADFNLEVTGLQEAITQGGANYGG
jgi:hypothetical protein